MDFKEFSKLIRVIAPAMKDNEISKVIKLFYLRSFKNLIVIVMETLVLKNLKERCAMPFQIKIPNLIPYKRKLRLLIPYMFQKVIEELKRIVKVNNVDYNQIFKNFDKD